MDQPSTKKPYITPHLFRIEPNQDQAILSACSLAANSGQAGGGAHCRRTNNCKRANSANGADSAARAS